MLWGLMLLDARLGLLLADPLPCCLVFLVVELWLALVLLELLLLVVRGGLGQLLPPLVFLSLLA